MGLQDRAAVWEERLRRYKRSGLTVAEFCQREAVSVPSFYQWRRRLYHTPAGPQAQQAAHTQRRQTAAFQSVLLTGGDVVSIEWPNGVRMELPAHQAGLVRSVVAELLHSASARATENV